MAKPGFHEIASAAKRGLTKAGYTQFIYDFQNFFHPFVGELVSKLNTDSLSGMMSSKWHTKLEEADPTGQFFDDLYKPADLAGSDRLTVVEHHAKEIDVAPDGPYANYNWELFFHIPLTIAVHLSKSQRFAEAQRWFHYIFDPTCSDTSILSPTMRFWKFLAFQKPDALRRIEDIVRELSDPAASSEIIRDYEKILSSPFNPHAVARTRHLAYQYCVVMKYLDNLIAWGDLLFQQDTVESINEATQLYVLAANVLGERPQRIPPVGRTRPKSYADLKTDMGRIGNALVELEAQFPFNLEPPPSGSGTRASGGSLLGIGQTVYFCIPPNDRMLGYWDKVADRLFKIRHCMNIAGVVRPLALFDPPLDPGMLVKAAAAGIDVGSIVSGLNQPIGPVRSLFLIQKALELCGEVRGLGSALLSALEKGDAEHLALVRQRHEIQIQQMAQDVRFLQWKSAQEATTSLLGSRKTVLERLHYYQRVLGLPADPNAPETLSLDNRELTEDNFDESYSALVGQYDRALTLQKHPVLKIVGDTSPTQQSGASGQGRLYLNTNEDAELNKHLPLARDSRVASNISDAVASVLVFVPEFGIDLEYWGLGSDVKVFGGSKLAEASKSAAEILRTIAGWEQDQAGMAGRTAGHERRADDWLLQYNLAAHELMQLGRQILTSLIAAQIAHHEYLNIQQQIKNAQEVDQILHDKFTNEDLYLWMQGEISRLYYEYYRFAFDTARKAEKTMKQELMRPEVDAQDFVTFNYRDGGRKGLLSGEALYLDVKRMEMAYHDNNKRELEVTRHVSLRQLDPLALLTLRATGVCQVTIPEWLYDLDCPGHYMRRIKNVAVSIPAVVGRYTSVNCTLSLLKSSLRKSPEGSDYARQGTEDGRFVDYVGTVQSIVTSGAINDAGMFETNLRDERFLAFEGAGAESLWKLELPKPGDYPAFDYETITDVILHVRYTARQGVDAGKVVRALDDLFKPANQSSLALLLSLPDDFPAEWSEFVHGAGDFTARIGKNHFPYFALNKLENNKLTISGLEVYDGTDPGKHHSIDVVATAASDLKTKGFVLSAQEDAEPNKVVGRKADASVFLIVRYSLG